jgi:putative DNA primase/helicase
MGGSATEVHVHESRWDCYSEASVTGWHLKPGIRFISTLGAANGKLVKGLIPKGARVYCWEQHDQPGQNGKVPNEAWFRGVAAAVGCEIFRVQIPPQHKDLNDWVGAGATEADLVAAVGAAKPYQSPVAGSGAPPPQPSPLFPSLQERPTYRVYDAPFQEGGKDWEAGVYLHDVKEKKDQTGNVTTTTLIDRWILSVARIIAITRNADGKGHGYLLEFIPHGENSVRREVIPQSLLVGHQDDLLMSLRSWGVSALYENKREILDYLDKEHKKFGAKQPEHFWESVNVVGWHSPACFVLPNQVIGNQSEVWFQGAGEGAQYSQKGTLDDWKRVAALCVGNPYLIFALSCGFTGPLLSPLNIPGVGFHYLGDSTSGKTTALMLGNSAWGSPKFMLSWRQTANRLETQAANRSDTLMTIDESHMIDPKVLDSCIYLLLGGVAKGRMKRDATAAATAHWRICVLSSGERSLETHLISAGLDHKAGQSIRICDIPVSGKYGVFDKLPAADSAAAFADRLRDEVAYFYGTAGPAFIERLIKETPKLDLQTALDDIVKNLPVDKLSAQQARVWRSFAAVGLAGELANKWEIVPWEQYSASNAAIDLFEVWRKAQPENSSSLEHAQILECVRNAISTHGTSQFSDLDGGTRGFVTRSGNLVHEPEVKVINRMGYWRDDNGKRLYLFTSEGLKRATKGHDWKRVLKALEDGRTFVKKGATQISLTTRIPGENRVESLYWIDPDKLFL